MNIIEIKRNIALALIKLPNGKLQFINPKLIPVAERIAHYAKRRTETLDGQS